MEERVEYDDSLSRKFIEELIHIFFDEWYQYIG